MNILYPRANLKFSKENIDEILKEIENVLVSGNLIQGNKVQEFENKFAKMVGTKFAVATNSCTSALEISIKSLGIKNKKILVPTETFMATANAVILSGNTPVFTDIDASTLCMSYDTIMDRITPDVSAIIIVHMGGLITPDIEKIRDYCKNYDIFLIEDAAHAHGSEYNGKTKSEHAGSIGDVGCFSFYPTKLMTTGEGGMITTNDISIFNMAQLLRNHGGNGQVGFYPASNDRMTEISAVLGISQLKYLEKFVEKRNYIAGRYRELLRDVSEITLFGEYDNIKNSYWNFYFLLENMNRDEFKEEMFKLGVQTGDAYSPPCHKQPVFKKYISNFRFDVAEDILKRHISLPMYVDLNDDDIKSITNKVKKVINRYEK